MSFGWLSDFSLHAFTFGAIHSVGIEFIRRWFLENYLVGVWRFIADVYLVWGSLGATLSGVAWESLGGSNTFLCAGLVTGVTAMIAWFSLRNARLGAQSI